MADEPKAKLRLEIAHVLFIDIVGYSKLLTDEQSEALQELNQIVRPRESTADTQPQLHPAFLRLSAKRKLDGAVHVAVK